MKTILGVIHAILFFPLATVAVILAVASAIFAALAAGIDYSLWAIERRYDGTDREPLPSEDHGTVDGRGNGGREDLQSILTREEVGDEGTTSLRGGS